MFSLAQLLAAAIGGYQPSSTGGAAGGSATLKQAYDAERGPDPGLDAMSQGSGMYGQQAPDMSQQGLSQYQPSSPGFGIATPSPQEDPFFGLQATSPQQAQPQALDNPYVNDTAKEVAADIGTHTGDQPQANPDDKSLDVVGFKPHKESVLQTIGDYFLMRRGLPPLFKQHNDEKNMQAAMKGFTQEPLNAIRNVASVDSGSAWKMYNDYQRQTNDDDLKSARATAIQDTFRNQFGNMLGSIANNKDPNAAYQKLKPTLSSWLEKHNLTEDALPDQWDPDWADAYRYGGFKTKDQLMQATRDRRVDVTESHYKATEAQAATNEAGRNARNSTNEAGRDARHTTPQAVPQATSTMTKYGPGVISKDKTKMVVHHEGKSYGYIRAGNNWVPIGEVDIK